MRTFILLAFSILSSDISNAQNKGLVDLMNQYNEIKVSLINNNSKLTMTLSEKFIQTIENTDVTAFSNKEQKVFNQSKPSVLKAASRMKDSSDPEKQKVSFSELSQAIWDILKISENLQSSIYLDYCSMKKAYWISDSATIQNPYYGGKMLNCGSISDKKIN